MSVNNHRKCSKCGRTRSEDLTVTYHRFPNPGTSNDTKAHAWAKYCWPNKDWSIESLVSLHNFSKVLCGRHFSSSQYYDNERQKLSKFAVPCARQDEVLNEQENVSNVAPSRIQNSIILEVCVDSFESALNAIHGGADELEVCSSLGEGGLTPTAGLVKSILSVVKKIGTGEPLYKACSENCCCQSLVKKPKVNVMIRCRTGSDFCYSHYEMNTMLTDVEIFKQMSVDRFVFGALTSSQKIDDENNARIMANAHPIPVTFHRAFDVAKDPFISISKIIQLGFNRLLTSGQRSSAGDDMALILIKSLYLNYGDKIEIMPGAGVSVANAKTFIDLGCKIVHSSCKKEKVLPKFENSLSMGTSDSESIFITDEDIVRKMKEVLTQM